MLSSLIIATRSASLECLSKCSFLSQTISLPPAPNAVNWAITERHCPAQSTNLCDVPSIRRNQTPTKHCATDSPRPEWLVSLIRRNARHFLLAHVLAFLCHPIEATGDRVLCVIWLSGRGPRSELSTALLGCCSTVFRTPAETLLTLIKHEKAPGLRSLDCKRP